MNPTLFILFIPMLLIAAFVKWKWHSRIHWAEFALQLIASVAIIAAVWGISTYSLVQDVETINGSVRSKSKDWVSCSHSYPCRCRTVTTGSGRHRSSYTKCDTCYLHSNDWDWNVRSTVGDFTISRIDLRGSDEPPRWSAVRVGQPVALPHGYVNYVKGAPESLFHAVGTYKGSLPEYPGFYDYQFSDRVLGVPAKYHRYWNGLLAEKLIPLGEKKQVNFVVVITDKGKPFGEALRSKWLGGKKNDIVVVIGSKHYPKIDWVKVFSWSKYDLVNVKLRNRLIESRYLQADRTVGIIADTANELYVRRPMSDFEYLKNDVHPSAWVMVLAFILGTLVSLGIAYWSHENDFH